MSAGTNVVGNLNDSVGLGGANRAKDVGVVQQLLKNKGYYGQSRIDRVCGPFTIQAIKAFQAKYVMRNPDGLIQPGRGTWRKLIDPNPNLLVRTGHPASATTTRLAPPVASSTSRALPAGICWPLMRNIIRRGRLNNTFGDAVRTATGPGGVAVPKAHQGWDFYAAKGTDCFAIGNGKVAHIQSSYQNGNNGGFGLFVVIELDSVRLDGQTVYAMYGHLSEIDPRITDNSTVIMGQVIGKTGNTGNAFNMTGTDEHLHFELRKIIRPGLGCSQRWDPKRFYGDPPLHAPAFDVGCTPND
jgi:murein DD-endopeptidase MepM/ murein hydrolase activator NlpD